mgnify:FL=1
MGLKIKDIVLKQPIKISDLSGKVLAVDTLNLLYQFLTTIRGPDGNPFTNNSGAVTSHLIGLFNRVTSLMAQDLKLIFVFDGKAPDLKRVTWEKREAAKKKASLLLEEAREAGDSEGMRKYAGRTVKLSREMIEDSKEVIRLLGLPVVQAPSEGEAQASHMVATGKAYGCVSQDYDNIVFGCPRLIRNLSIAGRRKRAGKFAHDKIEPEQIILDENLTLWELDSDQLIVLAVLIGTDYNPDGIKGIGQKKGLKLVKQFGHDFEALFSSVNWSELYPDLAWKEVFSVIKDMPVTDDYDASFKDVDFEGLVSCLVGKHEFNEDRVRSKLGGLVEAKKAKAQKGLGEWF